MTLAKPRKPSDNRRAQLLELGLMLFGGRSYEEVSIDDIAGEAGVSKGLLYHYFGGKRDYYVACLTLAAGRLVAAVKPDEGLDPEHRAFAGLSAYLEYVEDRAEAYTALMRGGLGNDEQVMTIIEGARDAVLAHVMEGLGLAGSHPVFRTGVRAWMGAVEAASLDWLERRELERDAVLQLLLAMLFATIAAAANLDPDAGVEVDAAAGMALLGLTPR